MLKSAPKHVIFIFKIQKFSGEGAQPPPPVGGGHPLPHPPPQRLDLRAFGAHSRTPHSEVWLLAWTDKLSSGDISSDLH